MSVVADANGVVTGRFTIPPNVPAGAKTVAFEGAKNVGTRGSAVFIGQGSLTVQTLRQVNTVTNYWTDPLAQTFVLDADTQICGADVWFTASGGDARIQIREVSNGVPTRVVLAEAHVPASSMIISGADIPASCSPCPWPCPATWNTPWSYCATTPQPPWPLRKWASSTP